MSASSASRLRVSKMSPSTPVNSDDDGWQLDMFSSGRAGSADDRWRTILTAIRQAVDEIGPQEVAYDNELTASALSHALAERDRHFPASLLVYLISRSRKYGPVIAGYFAALADCELHARKQFTPEEELARLKDALAKNLGPEMQRVVMRDAFGGVR